MTARSLVKLVALMAFLGGAVYFFRYNETGRSLNIERLTAFVDAAHPAVARLTYVVVYIVGTVLLLPGLLLSFVGAYLFGVWEGTLYTWIGATIGATLAFLLAKALGREFVDQLLRGKLQALDQRLRDHGFRGLLIIRLVPLFPFNGVNFGCGLTSIRTGDYILATALGIVPGTFIYQYLFATLGRRVLEEGFSWSDLATWDVALALAAFVAFVIGTNWIMNRIQTKTGEPGA